MKTGRPQVVAKYSTAQNGADVNTKGICPAALGSKDQQPASYDPNTKLFYVPTNHVCMATATNANSIGGERGSELRDSEAMQNEIKRFRTLQSKAKQSCFINVENK